jgi:hypothetical protein
MHGAAPRGVGSKGQFAVSGCASGACLSAGHTSPIRSADGRHLEVGPAVVFVVVVIVAFGVGWLIADRLLRPLLTIAATARDISGAIVAGRFRAPEEYLPPLAPARP